MPLAPAPAPSSDVYKRQTFPGAGLAGICTSEKNREDIKKRLTIQTIGHDKINQLRHARFFKDVEDVYKRQGWLLLPLSMFFYCIVLLHMDLYPQ